MYDGQMQAAADYINGLGYANPYPAGSDEYLGYLFFVHLLGI